MSHWLRKHRHLYPDDWEEMATRVKQKAGWKCQVCQAPHGPPPCVLTTDHLDFNPTNCSDENLMALCQRCHLRRQGMSPAPRTREEVFKRMKPKGKQLALRSLLESTQHLGGKSSRMTDMAINCECQLGVISSEVLDKSNT